MLTDSNECSTPEIYEKFVNSFLIDTSDFSKKSSGSLHLDIDPKIVEEVKIYFNNFKVFNSICIYNKAFGPSYRKAVDDLKPILNKKLCLFLLSLYDEGSAIYRMPTDLIYKILEKFYFQPTPKDFQCYIFKKMDLENRNVRLLVSKQIAPSARFCVQS